MDLGHMSGVIGQEKSSAWAANNCSISLLAYLNGMPFLYDMGNHRGLFR